MQPAHLFLKMLASRRCYLSALATESGQDLIEYAILCALIGVIVVSTNTNLANILLTIFNNMGNTINSQVSNIS